MYESKRGVAGRRPRPEAEAPLSQYCARLRKALRGDIDSILLYGSHARGDAAEGSDIDVLVVLKGSFDYGEMLERTSDATAEISLEYDIVISRAFVSREDYESKETPFLMNVRREAVRLC